eukprot:Clim_evm67s215 gene=Clim_evmTU67s215
MTVKHPPAIANIAVDGGAKHDPVEFWHQFDLGSEQRIRSYWRLKDSNVITEEELRALNRKQKVILAAVPGFDPGTSETSVPHRKRPRLRKLSSSAGEQISRGWKVPENFRLVLEEAAGSVSRNTKRAQMYLIPNCGHRWILVQLVNDQVFFYNTKDRKSQWTVPLELEEYFMGHKAQLATLIGSQPGQTQALGDDEEEADESEESSIPDIDMDAVIAEHAELEKGLNMSMVQRRHEFMTMLDELASKGLVSAVSIWDVEVDKVKKTEDPRFHYLTSTSEQAAVFQSWAEAHVGKLQDNQSQDNQRAESAKEEFFEFLASKKVTTKSNFRDIAFRFGSNPAFKAAGKDMKSRQNLFHEYKKKLKK